MHQFGVFCSKFCAVAKRSKCTQTERNAPKHEFRVQWCGSGAFVLKILTRHRCTNYYINCSSLACFALIVPVWCVLQQVSYNSKMVPNAPTQKKTHQNMSLGSNGANRERSLQKILARHRGMNICINCTSLARFAPSFVQQLNGPKSTRTERNTPKHEFRVQ